jgi:hypothetical protein
MMYVHVNRLDVEKATWSPTKKRRSSILYRVRVGVFRHIAFLKKRLSVRCNHLFLCFLGIP